ncbi:unnamed protein product [Microthlaspi erraticum]|uniref:PHD-type domain-containing protein n=1 Tax=Microthlaspi erraticum TaxID=1685480 RepID=A0A6D2KBI7_9BRAS|nr:unnamed protein product [Microthlaspi erraticum]CAA7057892.1 unnamed protein product [Microthlaspi erraticum]
MRSPNSRKPSYVALVEKIELHVEKNEVKVRVLWYYRPNDLYHGRKKFYGERELLLSDHDDVQSVETIEGKCIVHTLDDFMKLKCIREHDYYWRLEYKVHSAVYVPESAEVYCLCYQPHNPDVLMVECEKCNDWFHSKCIGMTDEEVKKMEHYFCSACNSRDEEVNGDEVDDDEVNDVEVAAPKRRRTG